jgi:hypothetical protein
MNKDIRDSVKRSTELMVGVTGTSILSGLGASVPGTAGTIIRQGAIPIQATGVLKNAADWKLPKRGR